MLQAYEEKPELATQAKDLVSRISSLDIVNAEQYAQATILLKGGRALRTAIEGFFQPMKERANQTHKEICKKEREQLDPIETSLRHLNAKMNKYDQEQQAAARRLKLEEEARLRKEQEDRRVREAAALETAGKAQLAERVLNAPQAAIVVPEAPKADLNVNGTRTRTNWRYRVVDPTLVPREYLVPCDKQIAARVKSSNGTCVIPGVEVYSEKSFY